MNSPYKSPSHEKNTANLARASSISLVILACSLLLTEVFATINTIDEGYTLAGDGLFLILIAGASQLPGLLIALWRWKRNSVAAIPMLCGAYLIALLGFFTYAVAAFDGPTVDSPDSMAHAHVVLIPMVHCVFAVLVYFACGTASAVIGMCLGGERRDEQSPALEPAAGLDSDGRSTPPAK